MEKKTVYSVKNHTFKIWWIDGFIILNFKWIYINPKVKKITFISGLQNTIVYDICISIKKSWKNFALWFMYLEIIKTITKAHRYTLYIDIYVSFYTVLFFCNHFSE